MTDITKDSPSGESENAFAADFAAAFEQEGTGAAPAAAAKKVEDWLVPWSVEPADEDQWAVFRPGESYAGGHEPAGLFKQKRTAEFYANVLFPVTQREPRFYLGTEPGEYGLPIYEKGKDEPVGHIQDPEPDFIVRFNMMANLSSSPRAMGYVLAEGGSKLVAQVGAASFDKARWLDKRKQEFDKE